MINHQYNFKKTLILVLGALFLAVSLSATVRTYTDNGDGTVKDNGTNLVWQKCSAGQNNDAGCTGTASLKEWRNALAYCEALLLGGRYDWRLPNLKELQSLADRSRVYPAIDTVKFPNTPGNASVNGSYWSSSFFVITDPSDAWIVCFDKGRHTYMRKDNSNLVRCVAGGL